MTADPRDAAFELVDVVKRYGPRIVLAGLTVAIRPGEFVALLGPNGVGKTTLVEMLEGYRVPDAGTVRVLGQDPRGGGPELRARVGVMLQDGGLDPRTTPRDILRLFAALHAEPHDPATLLDRVGLAAVAGTRVRRLSGGERQRLALAVALVGDPEVMILDEPTAGMDPEARRSTRALIAELHAEGRTILMTTHDLGDVERLASRVVILSDGRIVADDTPSGLLAGSGNQLTVQFDHPLDADELAAIRAALPFDGAVVSQGVGAESLRISGVDPDPDVIAAIAAVAAAQSLRIVALRAGASTLEDRYLALTGDHDVEAVA
ncbi:MAG: ABC transporter ATP-binding protein [Chloroflexota bacterium]|nr:MAG: ABC transporter ATP-binding protein [Chloroflexota bacterium]